MRAIAASFVSGLILGATAVGPAYAAQSSSGGGFGGSSAPPDGCTQTSNQILTRHVNIVDLADSIRVDCSRGQAIDATTSNPSHGGMTIPIGSACTATWYANVNTSQITANGLRDASWQPPPGKVLTNNTTHTLLSVNDQAAGMLSGAQPDLYTNLVYATYQQQGGTWDGSNCTGGGWTQCGRAFRPEGLGTSGFDPCITLTSYAPNPPDCTGACEQPVVDLLGQLSGHFDAGHTQRWPQSAEPPKVGAVVNLPVQFYIPDWSFNGAQQALRRWALVLVGPPDSHGRSRVFTYLVTAGLQGIDWDFGDGQSAHFGDANGFGQNIHPPNGSSTVAHPYTRISEPNAYHVTATETWGFRVDKYWIGGHVEETNLEKTFQVLSSTDVAVGQVEPIPCSGTGCA